MPGRARRHIIFLAADDAARKADALKARIELASPARPRRRSSACPTGDLSALGTFESLSRLRDGTLRGIDSLPYDGKDTSEFDARPELRALASTAARRSGASTWSASTREGASWRHPRRRAAARRADSGREKKRHRACRTQSSIS